MSIEIQELALRYGTAWAEHDLDAIMAMHTDDTVFHLHGGGEPAMGVVLAPALGRLFAGVVGGDAFVEEKSSRTRLACRIAPPDGITVVGSRSHADAQAMNAFLGEKRVAQMLSAGSSLKFCMIAAGEADLYPRLGTTMEWDTAAGHAVVAAAGGRVTRVDGGELSYGKPGLLNPHFVAMGR